jgi:hypothetical protein
MPSSQASSEGGSDPVAVLGQLAHWLATASFDCALGVALGTFAARSMRARHLHWSWAACALVLLVLARPGLHGPAFALALASLLAATRNRRWQREDIEAGGDLAELAARRQTPVDLLRTLARAGTLRLRARVAAERWTGGHELLLGVDEHRRGVSIPFDASGDGGHALVVGATGSGKTVTETSIATHAIERGMGAIVVDPKGDRDMRERVRRAALAAGREFLEWTPDGDCVYNPYALGGASEIADKALAGEQFTEPHYLRQAQRYLGHVVRALRRCDVEVSLRTIVEHMDPGRLELLARALPEVEARAACAYLDSLSSRQRSELSGVRDRLAILAESDLGPWLDPQTVDAERFDLLGAVRRRAVVYFSLHADSRPLLSQMLAAALVIDLQTAVAALQRAPVPTLVVIDEFSAIAGEQVVRLFARARSAGFTLVLGTQEISDLRLAGHERLLEQVLGNLSVLIAHRQVVPSSAELISEVAGTRGAWRVSRHSDGRWTRTRGREPVLDADRVMSLARGWAAVLVLGDGGRARIARIFSAAARR